MPHQMDLVLDNFKATSNFGDYPYSKCEELSKNGIVPNMKSPVLTTLGELTSAYRPE